MDSLAQTFARAQAERFGVGHFNVSELVALKAIVEAARARRVPVIVGLSEGERAFVGIRQASALVGSLRDESELPIYLNADHTHSLAGAVEAAKAGFDWIVFDLSKLPFAENVRQTREAVEALKSIRPDILVEGELGDIGSGSELHEGASPPAVLTTAEDARQFVAETHVDTLAPAVGNRHGIFTSMLAQGVKQRLALDRIREIKAAVQVPLTLHGASGTDDADLRACIEAGITVVHINTEVRIAWRRGLEEALRGKPKEIVPYKLLPEVVTTVRNLVDTKLALLR
jgi:fructose-bisphosphate aldolase class II